jgi:hypothetical protein
VTTVAIPAEQFAHGDHRRYGRGCRCTTCTTAQARYRKILEYRRHTGNPGRIPATRAAAHIRALRLAGMDDTAIMRAAQIGGDALYRAADAETRINRATETSILAVPIPHGTPSVISCANTDATATWRRLQALARAGWPATVLAERLGCTPQNVGLLLRQTGTGKVHLHTEQQIRDLYINLWHQRPEAHGVPGWIADRSRRYAASRGWHPAGAWDNIGDPNEQPQYGRRATRVDAVVEDTAELARQGLNREAIAERLGISWNAVCAAHARADLSVPEIAG